MSANVAKIAKVTRIFLASKKTPVTNIAKNARITKPRAHEGGTNEKVFDSVDRATLWKLLRHYGVPEKLTNIIRNSYDRLTCRVVHGGRLTDAFQVRTGVRQGCLPSPFLFLLAIDRVMKRYPVDTLDSAG